MADQALENRAPNSVSDLDNLAKQIDAAHVAVEDALLTSVQRAAEAGHLLAQAKEQVPHGQWETWVTENTAVSPRGARGYMQVARYWIEADKANRRALADLGLQGLLAKIAEPRCTPAVEPEDTTAAPAEPKTIKFRVIEEEPKTSVVRVVRVPGEDSERTAGSDQSQIAATMKIIREAEEKSATPHVIMGDSIQSGANLDGINREWDKLDMAGRDKFLSEKLRTHGHPDFRDMDIIDVLT